MDIRRGRIRGFDLVSYTAQVEILGSQGRYLAGVPVAHHIPPGELAAGTECGVVFFDEVNQADGCVAFLWSGRPTPTKPSLIFPITPPFLPASPQGRLPLRRQAPSRPYSNPNSRRAFPQK